MKEYGVEIVALVGIIIGGGWALALWADSQGWVNFFN
jgi:hypothetical protein